MTEIKVCGIKKEGDLLRLIDRSNGFIVESESFVVLFCNIVFISFIEKTTIDLKISNQEIKVLISTCSLEKLLKNSDFISLHVPMPKDGQPLISTNEFNSMKKGVRIVNAARGGVSDESALVKAIKNEIVSFAALDVFVGEPYPNESLLKNEKISLTPHIGAATSEAQDRIGTELADKIINFYNQ